MMKKFCRSISGNPFKLMVEMGDTIVTAVVSYLTDTTMAVLQ